MRESIYEIFVRLGIGNSIYNNNATPDNKNIKFNKRLSDGRADRQMDTCNKRNDTKHGKVKKTKKESKRNEKCRSKSIKCNTCCASNF